MKESIFSVDEDEKLRSLLHAAIQSASMEEFSKQP